MTKLIAAASSRAGSGVRLVLRGTVIDPGTGLVFLRCLSVLCSPLRPVGSIRHLSCCSVHGRRRLLHLSRSHAGFNVKLSRASSRFARSRHVALSERSAEPQPLASLPQLRSPGRRLFTPSSRPCAAVLAHLGIQAAEASWCT